MCACNELHMRAGCGKSACPVRRGLRKAVILPHSSVTLLVKNTCINRYEVRRVAYFVVEGRIEGEQSAAGQRLERSTLS